MKKNFSLAPGEQVQRKHSGGVNANPEDDESVQAKSNGNASGSTSLESQLHSSKGKGTALPEGTRKQMEGAFNADFSSVRVHTGTSAVQMNKELSAQAFTHGSDIYFNEGKYDTQSPQGNKLLAHELTHTVQQGGSNKQIVQKKVGSKSTQNNVEVTIQIPVKEEMTRKEFIIYYLKVQYGESDEDALKIYLNDEKKASEDKRFQGPWKVTSADVRQTYKSINTSRGVSEFTTETESSTVYEPRLPNGRREGYDERKKKYDELPAETKNRIVQEVDKRYWARTGIKENEKIKSNQTGNAETWLDIRDELLMQHEFIHSLPEKVLKFMVVKTGGNSFKPEDYEQLTRIAQKIMSMSDADVDAYLSSPLRVTDDLDEFEHSIDNFLERGTIEDESLDDPVFEPTDAFLDDLEGGGKIQQYGVVQTNEGGHLWAAQDRTKNLGTLPLNTKVFVDRDIGHEWVDVYVEKHQRGKKLPVKKGTHGYMAKNRINFDMPDPEAWLYRIKKAGIGALALARKLYKGYKTSHGDDFRYLVNVLVAVNEAKGRWFLKKEKADDPWEDTKTFRGGQIWVPGLPLVKALKGQISSGSITYEILATLKDIAIGVAAFIVGLLHGAFQSIADVFIGIYDLAKLAKEILVKLLFKRTLISDAKAFFEEISEIKISDVIAMVGKKWNDPDTWSRWKFRGYVLGYAIMEIVMLFFSAGAITAIKWAGKVSKVGKLSKYLSKLPKVQKLIKGAKALKGKEINRIRKFLKAAESMSQAHGWAAKVLRIPMHILRRLSEADIGKLKKLPQWAREKFARLSEKSMLKILRCKSPCKVDPREIQKALNLATKAGKKLDSPDEVVEALRAVRAVSDVKDFNLTKISSKLRKKNSALMTAIKDAELTDTDFAKLAKFLTVGDVNPAQAYSTFARYITAVVPAKVGDDIEKLNKVAAAMVKVEKGRGAALKGSMFEQWIALHVPELASKTYRRIIFDLKSLIGKTKRPFSRPVDKWIPNKGQIWEMKHQLSKVPKGQADDYAALLGKVAPDGNLVKSINYVFPNKASATLNKHLKAKPYSFAVYYIDEVTNKLTKLP